MYSEKENIQHNNKIRKNKKIISNVINNTAFFLGAIKVLIYNVKNILTDLIFLRMSSISFSLNFTSYSRKQLQVLENILDNPIEVYEAKNEFWPTVTEMLNKEGPCKKNVKNWQFVILLKKKVYV